MQGVDLNRDYVANRTSNEIWKHVIPQYYTSFSYPSLKPESKALDQLAAQESFDAVVSLHSFGGYIFIHGQDDGIRFQMWKGITMSRAKWPKRSKKPFHTKPCSLRVGDFHFEHWEPKWIISLPNMEACLF